MVDYISTTEAAAGAGKDASRLRAAAARGSLGPLARQEMTARGMTWLVHPALAVPAVYSNLVGPAGRPRDTKGEPEAAELAMQVIIETEDEQLWRQAAELVRAVEENSPMVAHRAEVLVKAMVRSGYTPSAEVVGLLGQVVGD